MDDELGDKMESALRTYCPECNAELPRLATLCPACGAAVDDEENSLSFQEHVEDGADPQRPGVERRANYRLLVQAAKGIADGSMTEDDYRRALQKLRQVATNGLKVIESKPFQKKLSESSADAQHVGAELRRAFVQLQEGLQLMEGYLEMRDSVALRAGLAAAEVAFFQLDEVERASANLEK